MSDIDFDELDKAVNSVMSKVDTTKRDESVDDPEDKVITLDTDADLASPASDANAATSKPAAPVVQSADPIPAPTKPAETAAPVAAASTPALAVKRRGQFMDVIHPSSDMKAVPKPMKREGIALVPTVADVLPELAPADTEPATSTLAAAADQPVASEVPEVQLAADEENLSMSIEPTPLVSPFLPDAKPEKRPLGGGSSDASEVSVVASPDDVDVATEPASDERAEQSDVPAETSVLPEELQTDVLALETADTTVTVEPTMEPQTDVATEAIAVEDTPEPPEEPAAEPAVPAGGSIAQQYTESPSSGDQTNGSIYDTSNYHQPIEAAPAAKKSSPLKWIILAIVLLVLGAGGGVGYFVLTHGLPF